jgi:hypothetical protein
MPKSTAAPARNGRPPLSGSAEIEAMVARTAPAILEFLGDGIPRSKSAIITALADRHPKEDVVRTLMRPSASTASPQPQRRKREDRAQDLDLESRGG